MKTLNTLIISFIFLFTFSSSELFAFSQEVKQEKIALIKELKRKGEIVYAIIPKNSAEPFYQPVAKGCKDRAKELGVNCIYYGSSPANMRLQVNDILDLIDAGVDGISVAAVRKDYINSVIKKEIKEWAKAFISFDSPLNSDISMSYIGTNNYLLGKSLGEEIRKLKPNGGNYCIQTERHDSPNHNDRVHGIVDGLTNSGLDSSKWKVVPRCPQKTMGDFEVSLKQMEVVLKFYEVDVFASTGGGPQFLPEQYREVIAPFKDKIESGELIFANIDTMPFQLEYLKEGISTVNVGQRPYDMGKMSIETLIKLSNGEKVPEIIYTGLTYCTKDTADTCTK